MVVPPDVLDRVNAWEQLHPGWQVFVWTNASILRQFPDLYDVFISSFIQTASWASDLVRYHVLARFGGLYLDTDILPLRAIPSSLMEKPFTVCESPRNYNPSSADPKCIFACPAVIASPRGNSELKSVAEGAVRNTEQFVKKNGKGCAFDPALTGPIHWSKAVLSPGSSFKTLPSVPF